MVAKVSLLACLFMFSIKSYSKDIFEYGVGIFALHTPEYVGAKENKNILSPLPYFYFKSEKIEISRKGLLGHLWQNERWKIDISASATLPVHSKDITTRKGMQDIDWTFQLGPSLKYFLFENNNKPSKMYAEFFLRKAITTDFTYVDNAGWLYGASLSFKKLITASAGTEINFHSKFTTTSGSSDFQKLYYDISQDDSLENRLEYKSKSGLYNNTFSNGLTYRKNNLWLAGFFQYANNSNAKNRHSDLVKKNHNFSIGIGISWIFN